MVTSRKKRIVQKGLFIFKQKREREENSNRERTEKKEQGQEKGR